MIDMYVDEMNMKAAAVEDVEYHSRYFEEEPQVITSMKEVEGFVDG